MHGLVEGARVAAGGVKIALEFPEQRAYHAVVPRVPAQTVGEIDLLAAVGVDDDPAVVAGELALPPRRKWKRIS